jgi:hypothetical protein
MWRECRETHRIIKLVGSCGFASHETTSDTLGKYDIVEELALIRTLGTGGQADTYPIAPLFRVSAGDTERGAKVAELRGLGE